MATQLNVKVEVHSNIAEVRQRESEFAMETAIQIAELGMKYAKEAVSPGRGPGPHPHRTPHDDTGDLAAGLYVEPMEQGFLKTARFIDPSEYGKYLEYGWTTKAGTFWRYPWAFPAMMRAQRDLEKVARSTSRRFLSDLGRPSKGRVDIGSKLAATWRQ